MRKEDPMRKKVEAIEGTKEAPMEEEWGWQNKPVSRIPADKTCYEYRTGNLMGTVGKINEYILYLSVNWEGAGIEVPYPLI